MQVFVFDTETTGLTVRDGSLAEQPRIIEFGGILVDLDHTGNCTEISRIDERFNPWIPIPFASSSINGIYDSDVADMPPIGTRIDAILQYLNTADMVAGHNIEFDENLVRYELMRLGRDGFYQPRQRLCTMLTTTDYCKLSGRGFSYKPPKLNELYMYLFGERFTGAHRAIVDVEATLKIVVELVKRKVIVLESSPVISLF